MNSTDKTCVYCWGGRGMEGINYGWTQIVRLLNGIRVFIGRFTLFHSDYGTHTILEFPFDSDIENNNPTHRQ